MLELLIVVAEREQRARVSQVLGETLQDQQRMSDILEAITPHLRALSDAARAALRVAGRRPCAALVARPRPHKPLIGIARAATAKAARTVPGADQRCQPLEPSPATTSDVPGQT